MMRTIFILILTHLLACCFVAQTTSPCPEIKVDGPSTITPPGDAATFTARLSGSYDPNKIEYRWTVSSGVISDGLGTSVIKIQSTREMAGYNITATVEIKGLPPYCQNTASDTVAVLIYGDPMLLDEYEKLTFAKEKIRLDAVIKHLKEDEATGAVFIFYGLSMKPGSRASAKRRRNISGYLIAKRITVDRFQLVFGGDVTPSGSSTFTKIWIVPKGTMRTIVN